MEGTNLLNTHIHDYFLNLFTSQVGDTDAALLQKFLPKVTNQMNDFLLTPFTADDVKHATFSIGDLKAPGPDGLHALFFQKMLAFSQRRNNE